MVRNMIIHLGIEEKPDRNYSIGQIVFNLSAWGPLSRCHITSGSAHHMEIPHTVSFDGKMRF